MGWLIALVAVVLLAVLASRKLRGATIYLSHSHGYTAHSFGVGEDDKLRPVSRERYERILELFVQGDLFDCLWVSLLQDRYGGLVMSNEGVETELGVSFRSLKEPERLAAFCRFMADRGHVPSVEHPWNVELGVDSESITFEYLLPTDLDVIRQTVDHALEALQGETGEAIFVHAWRSQDGPKGGVGITVRVPHDVLAQVL